MAESLGVIAGFFTEQVSIVRELVVPVRTDEFDAVHRMRVAARRMQAALKVWRPLMDANEVDLLRTELRWLAHALGAARDAEVLEERLDEALAGDTPTLSAARSIVDAHLDRTAAQAHAELADDLESERFDTLLQRLERCASDPPLLWDEPRFDTLVDLLAAAWATALVQWRAVPSAARGLGADDPRHEQAHRARRRAKTARYLADVLADVDPRLEPLADAFKRVSDEVGDSHDAVVASRLLAALADGATQDVRKALVDAAASQADLAEECLASGGEAVEDAALLAAEVLSD
ncbi:MAG TPA: CHAD domain-containing protein [Propionibacteriaceae bacterium]|nr:CHAD domain-containing protein [Propionibacteriaceae bacterium]